MLQLFFATLSMTHKSTTISTLGQFNRYSQRLEALTELHALVTCRPLLQKQCRANQTTMLLQVRNCF